MSGAGAAAVPAPAEDAPPSAAFPASALKGGLQVVGGWLWGQSLITLVPLMPGVGPKVLLVAVGLLGAVPLWLGLRQARARAPVLIVDADGLDYAPAGDGPRHRVAWREVRGWRFAPGQRVAFRLADAPALARRLPLTDRAGMALGRLTGQGDLVIGVLRLEANLARLRDACRAHAPHLEER